ncbi:hypothetical protein HI113_25245 [Corallococcus exiguus]|uniref:glutathione binding-like protein n=1 Tax=Corallococcus exiguus TaxID=83462 RepID=UPI0014737EFB|nr:glutathione binding-like protein [Corallococcus exiguus]NNB97216.1 hypothetical protein [Corallococcus exiguus]
MALPTLVYGVPSGCSFGSIVALEWLGQPYQLCRIAMPEDVTTAEPEKQALRNLGARKVVSAHANLEALMGDTPWLLGNHRTLADAYFIGIARWTRYHEVLDRRDYPKLQGLFERLEADVGVRFAHSIEKGETPQGSGALQGHIRLAEALRRLPA